ncbi:WhiB family transcriptional regulator [Prescottella defluvii]|nr:WhiB family transcriptional regulator [Prescottella defluvii]
MTAAPTLVGPLTAADPTRWERAACRSDAHPDRWFPDPSESYDYAAAVCARCPIVDGCAAYAAGTRQSGVWGGREYRRGAVIR